MLLAYVPPASTVAVTVKHLSLAAVGLVIWERIPVADVLSSIWRVVAQLVLSSAKPQPHELGQVFLELLQASFRCFRTPPLLLTGPLRVHLKERSSGGSSLQSECWIE